MSEQAPSNNDNLLWAILVITVVAGLGNALMINSLSGRLDGVDGSASGAYAMNAVEGLPEIRPVSGTVNVASPKPSGGHAPAPAPHAKAKTKAKAKAKASAGEGKPSRDELNGEIDAFVGANGIAAAKTAGIKKSVNSCYDALQQINTQAKNGKLDKAQRQKRMLVELKKRDDALAELIGADLAKKLKQDVLSK